MKIQDYFKRWRVVRLTPFAQKRSVFSLLRLYGRLDRDIERFKKSTGIKCAAGCGRCCENPEVETTVLECLPIAVELWRQNQAEDWLKKAEARQLSGPCVFYQPHPHMPGHGRCSVYPWRPLICRLFGFSANTDKNNQTTFVTCATIKKLYADQYIETQTRIGKGLSIPAMFSYSLEVMNINPELGKKQLPINEAIKIAIEKVGLFNVLLKSRR